MSPKKSKLKVKLKFTINFKFREFWIFKINEKLYVYKFHKTSNGGISVNKQQDYIRCIDLFFLYHKMYLVELRL